MKEYYQIPVDETIKQFETDQKTGLAQQTADKRLDENGPNEIQQGQKTSPWKLLWNNINNLIVYLLLAAAVISFLMDDLAETIAILLALLLAVLTGFFTELKAQKSVESLQSMIYTTTTVIRDGKTQTIEASKVVPGDILLLREGDAIAADGRIIASNNFACIESALTGESDAVEKNADEIYEEEMPLGDQGNVVFAGTAVTRGYAYIVVTETGMETEVGKISGMLDEENNDKTPLDIELDKLSKAIIFAALIAGVAVLIAGLITDKPFVEMIHISIILAVAAIPEAMPAVETITLSKGMRTMAERKALVKTLPAVETLGATSVIASDKTGTLTENQMMASEVVLSDETHYEVTGEGYDPNGTIKKDEKEINPADNKDLMQFIQAGVLCNTAHVDQNEDGQYEVVGDPTDGALVTLGKKVGLDRQDLEEEGFEKIAEVPFSSENKYMIVVYEKEEQRELIIKGAFDVILGLADQSQKTKDDLQQQNERFAEKGQRVIAIASVEGYDGGLSEEELKESLDGLKIQGLVGIIDPPRPDAYESIETAQNAGIKVKMITGDHPKTASIIAKDIGLADYEKIMTGKEIDEQVDNDDFAQVVDETAVFARVSPENKMQIVSALKKESEVVSMTGDGVNDAPALNDANIGVAMGVRGTEVAKEASDMILTDDRFGTIVDSVEEGRIIFDNIKKYVSFLFACNMVEIIAIFASVVFLLPMPIAPLHILFLNLIIDIAPAMSLSYEPAEENVMERGPRSKKDSLVNRHFLTVL
ncbi:cation-translocating P-type ATPase [Tetragenococcus koreensis]|uniref:Cation-transporting ATPase n=1 Tax=Tetragenococcus koreensis TaxID=290335 RepID=A0AAN4UDI2_9ENTE|nr:HAD-IC family P-type ATPase [Tetragenococcus koreensis]GEQ50464.1 cation-transporting ATPase [Tetragenococcus koreensis]GEQ52967.1 cation-transporting ATPase [Tetragenococcus koreensis]GEQ55457.1 cation-transporting ATPase [Tetragenococcus koreensis]GEQ57942.1 cation-transporting ATPase [Tetragenococcus koreensis]GEQ60458.1 cation-transporting ATPase [Tetragenococcus koreensis]